MWRWVGVGCPRLGALPRGTASWCEGRRGAKGGGARRRGVKDRSARGDYHPTTTHLPLSKVTLFFAQLSAYTSPYPPFPRSPLLSLRGSPTDLGIQLSASNTPNLADLTANTAPTGTANRARHRNHQHGAPGLDHVRQSLALDSHPPLSRCAGRAPVGAPRSHAPPPCRTKTTHRRAWRACETKSSG